jgi:SAM-dependent methyltransferase
VRFFRGGRRRPAPSAELLNHYEVEKELADRLRSASAAERRHLYNDVYRERLQRIPTHPLLERAADPRAQAAATEVRTRLLAGLVAGGSTFLEIGPGDCALACAMARRTARVIAVDVADGLVTQGDDWPANMELVISDGTALPVPAESIDVAYSDQLLEHLHPDDAIQHLVAVRAALVPGGIYVCITPNRLSGPWDVSRGFDDEATGLHLREYSISELADAMESVGFRVHVFGSWRGHRVTPRLPLWAVVPVERAIAALPAPARTRVAHGLTLLKVVGEK